MLDEFRHGFLMLVRLNRAGASKTLMAAHPQPVRARRAGFSVGWGVECEHGAIALLPDGAWTLAIDVDLREHAAVAELTGLLP
jgi:hypothetical protein